jgi:hypothetical protein
MNVRVHIRPAASIIAGTIVGFVSGVTGVGGGILRCATGTHFARAKHAARGGVIGNHQFLEFGRCTCGLVENITDHAASITDLACGGRRGRNSWFMAGVKHLPAGLLRCNLSAFLLAGCF